MVIEYGPGGHISFERNGLEGWFLAQMNRMDPKMVCVQKNLDQLVQFGQNKAKTEQVLAPSMHFLCTHSADLSLSNLKICLLRTHSCPFLLSNFLWRESELSDISEHRTDATASRSPIQISAKFVIRHSKTLFARKMDFNTTAYPLSFS